jgi:hypothetical protein
MPLLQDPDRDYRPPLVRPEKDLARARLAEDVAAFVARGGAIQNLEWWDSGLRDNITWISSKGRLDGKSGAGRLSATINPRRQND